MAKKTQNHWSPKGKSNRKKTRQGRGKNTKYGSKGSKNYKKKYRGQGK